MLLDEDQRDAYVEAHRDLVTNTGIEPADVQDSPVRRLGRRAALLSAVAPRADQRSPAPAPGRVSCAGVADCRVSSRAEVGIRRAAVTNASRTQCTMAR
jgi:hypothetical protein